MKRLTTNPRFYSIKKGIILSNTIRMISFSTVPEINKYNNVEIMIIKWEIKNKKMEKENELLMITDNKLSTIFAFKAPIFFLIIIIIIINRFRLFSLDFFSVLSHCKMCSSKIECHAHSRFYRFVFKLMMMLCTYYYL